MSSNGSANELLASMMPMTQGGWTSENFEGDWGIENGDVYSVTVVPGSEWYAFDSFGEELGAKGAPITVTREVENNALVIGVGAAEDTSIEEPTEDQYCEVEFTFSKPEAGGIQSVTITPAIGDSTARLSGLFPLQYEEGAENEYKFRLSTAVDPQAISIGVTATPIGDGWCTLTASDGTNRTSAYAGGSVSKSWGGVNFPATITIKGSSDQAGTESVYTFIIKGPAD